MVATNRLYSPSELVEVLTGKYYIFDCDCGFDIMHELLRENGIESDETPLWDYPLNEIDHIVANDIPVVLVRGMVEDENGDFKHELRWFEIPAECVVDFEEV